MDPEAIALLREIRDEARQTNVRLDQTVGRLDQTNARLDQTNARLEQTVDRLDQSVALLNQTAGRVDQVATGVALTNTRLGSVETVLLDLAEQQRFVVRYLRTLSERDGRLDDDLSELQRRVDRIEERLGPG